ncbi:MAG TPA: class I adenylate-forming enzyme family protein [Acidimicrobiales bacterium]|nr:class I adenylate-forming enzyme family protein [Acidimicrobiales bacterium]
MRGRTIDPEDAARYHAAGWWGNLTLSDLVSLHARTRPGANAFVTPAERATWADYDRDADLVAGAIRAAGVQRGERVAVLLPDGPFVHAAFVGAERAGAIIVGIGARAGEREVAHLVSRTGAVLAITDRADVPVARRLTTAQALAGPALASYESLGPDEPFLLNSTSGTTGLPKCVVHTQNRWFYFHQLAVATGELSAEDVFLSAIPAPFGFGLWTAHFSPTVLGVPTVLAVRFDAGVTLDMIERERVSVLACVSTQFILMLEEQAARPRDLSSLRAMYTGGEAVPYERAAEFEDRAGALVLQFYGSNETGVLSGTTTRDSRDRRLRTAGRVIDDMEVRLFSEDGAPVPVPGRGIPGCKGPATCVGYWDDDDANAKLFTDDGWMLMGDVVEIDGDGYLKVVGRVSDFIIRGGKNISAPAVEDEVGTHPGVAMVAVVGVPDPVFGERVCAVVEPRPGWESLTLSDVTAHLDARGVTKEWWPERLVVMAELPRSSGGKVAKGDLRKLVAEGS